MKIPFEKQEIIRQSTSLGSKNSENMQNQIKKLAVGMTTVFTYTYDC